MRPRLAQAGGCHVLTETVRREAVERSVGGERA